MNKENYRPVSLLSHMSKVFERILYNQLNDFMKDKLSNILTDFRKGHSAQHSLLIMTEKWKRALDENMKVGAIFMDLSKVFDTLNHILLLAKLKPYGLQPTVLKQIENNLIGRFQRTKVSNSYSSRSEIIASVPQGSILEPLIFNIFLDDLFLYPEEIFLSNYADDNTLYSVGNTIESVKKALSNDFRIIQNWFHENLMVLNAKKCHYMCFGIVSENDDFIFDGIKLPNSCEEKILGVIIDNELKFDPHTRSICKRAAQKLGVLNRISALLDPEKKKLVFNAVIKSHLSYCPLIWMFSSRRSNNLINRIHKRSLRIVYNDTSSTFQELLQRNRSVSIHHKNIQTLTTEVFTAVNNICPPIMKTFFDFSKNRYNIRKFQKMRQ